MAHIIKSNIELYKLLNSLSIMKNIALSGGFLFLVVNGAKDFSLDKKLS